MNTPIESLTYAELQQVARHLMQRVSRDTLEQAARAAIAHTSKHVRYAMPAWMKPAPEPEPAPSPIQQYTAAELQGINMELRGLTPTFSPEQVQAMDDDIRGIRKLPRSEADITPRRGKRRR